MIGNASHRKREVNNLPALSPDPAGRLNQLREEDHAAELAEEREYEREYAEAAKRQGAWDRLYRKVGGPRPSWYLPETVWWVGPSGHLEVDDGAWTSAWFGESSIESLVARGYEIAAVKLVAGRRYEEEITLARSKFLSHDGLLISLQVYAPRNVSADVPSPFRWGGTVPEGWIVWREELASGRDVLRLVK